MNKNKFVNRVNNGTASSIAVCFTCGWREEGVTEAAIEARRHTKTTGHRTLVENAHSFAYELVKIGSGDD